MKKLTQRQILYRHLESLNGQWVQAFKLRGVYTAFGFSGHQADRRLRELAAEGSIEHRIHEGYAEYRVVKRPKFVVESANIDFKEVIKPGEIIVVSPTMKLL